MKKPTKPPTPAAVVPEEPATEVQENPDRIVLEDIGPIEHCEIVARPGKITILEGPNGVGKTMTLNAARALGGADVRLPKRDRAVDGVASGFGVTIKVGIDGRNRRSGKLVCRSIDADVDIGEIINPGIDDPAAADAEREKLIVTLLNLKVTDADIAKLLGGSALWNKYCAEIEPAGAVEFLGKVKRALEKAARANEADATALNAEIKASAEKLAALRDHGLTLEQAREQHAAASRAVIDLESQNRAAASHQQAVADAQSRIDAEQQKAKRVTDLEMSVSKLVGNLSSIDAELTEVRDRVRQLEQNRTNVANEIEIKQAELRAAQDAAANVITLRNTLTAMAATAVPDDVLQAARDAETAAGVVFAEVMAWERAATDRETLAGKKTLAAEATARAEKIRDTVDKLPNLLADAIRKNVPQLSVGRDMRLVVTGHPTRGQCYFGELSDGERAKLVVSLAVAAGAASGDPVLLAMGQTAWEGLDGDARLELAAAVEQHGVRLLTAQADRRLNAPRELRASEYVPGK